MFFIEGEMFFEKADVLSGKEIQNKYWLKALRKTSIKPRKIKKHTGYAYGYSKTETDTIRAVLGLKKV